MPALFSLAQHPAMEGIQRRLRDNERLSAFLDDICVVCHADRVASIFTMLQEELFQHSAIQVHLGKTKLWNQGGVVPSGAAALTAAARISDPDATVWCGDQALPTSEQGIRILGTPLGHPDCVRAELSQLSIKHDALMDKITHVQDLQCAWLLLLCCSAARANCYLRVVHPDLCSTFATHHAASCLVHPSRGSSFLFWNVASLPLSLGGLGLRSASLLSRAACWASWADSLQMVQQRHPAVSHQILRSLHDPNPHFHLSGLRSSVDFLTMRGFVPPTWEDLAAGLRPAPDRHGWQKVATEPVHGHHITSAVWPWLSVSEKALL